MNLRRFLPLFYLYVEIPFVNIRTMLMGEQFAKGTREYIVLQIRIWKWKFEFELYDTMKRIDERKKKKNNVN